MIFLRKCANSKIIIVGKKNNTKLKISGGVIIAIIISKIKYINFLKYIHFVFFINKVINGSMKVRLNKYVNLIYIKK